MKETSAETSTIWTRGLNIRRNRLASFRREPLALNLAGRCETGLCCRRHFNLELRALVPCMSAMLGDHGIKVVDWMLWNSKTRTQHPSRKPTQCKLKLHIKNLVFPFLVNFRNNLNTVPSDGWSEIRYQIHDIQQKRYCWHRRFTCGRSFHALHIPLLKDIFRVWTVHLSFLKFYPILTQRASCIKKKVFFPGFTKFRCDLLPLNLQYTEKNDISTPVFIERI